MPDQISPRGTAELQEPERQSVRSFLEVARDRVSWGGGGDIEDVHSFDENERELAAPSDAGESASGMQTQTYKPS